MPDADDLLDRIDGIVTDWHGSEDSMRWRPPEADRDDARLQAALDTRPPGWRGGGHAVFVVEDDQQLTPLPLSSVRFEQHPDGTWRNAAPFPVAPDVALALTLNAEQLAELTAVGQRITVAFRRLADSIRPTLALFGQLALDLTAAQPDEARQQAERAARTRALEARRARGTGPARPPATRARRPRTTP